MSKVICYIATSVDGYIAAEKDSLEWLDQFNEEISELDDAIKNSYVNFYKRIDTVVMGRTTYDVIDSITDVYPYIDKKNIVVTSTKLTCSHNVDLILNIEELTNYLKSSTDTTWIVGGGMLVSGLLDMGLIDELIITQLPIILGKGSKLFVNDNTHNLEVMSLKNDGNIVEIHYKVK